MKKFIISAIMLLSTVLAFSQTTDADKILGTYFSEDKTGKIQTPM
jgi:hypothetical protein